MQRIEHAPAGIASTVTMGTVRVGGRWMVEVVVYPAVQRAALWYRGGMGVTILVSAFAARLDIERAGPEGPFKLRARVSNGLEKLPPVQLRVPLLPDMLEREYPAEPVAYEAFNVMLRLSLPSWARRAPAARVLDGARA